MIEKAGNCDAGVVKMVMIARVKKMVMGEIMKGMARRLSSFFLPSSVLVFQSPSSYLTFTACV